MKDRLSKIANRWYVAVVTLFGVFDDGETSWELSANYAMSDQSSLYGRVASGFRAQTIQGRDVAFGEVPTVADPETINSLEAGYKTDLLDSRLRLNFGVFTYTVDDMQLSVIGGASNTNRTGSSFPPIPRGCTSQEGFPEAMEGQISSMWDPSMPGPAGSKW